MTHACQKDTVMVLYMQFKNGNYTVNMFVGT